MKTIYIQTKQVLVYEFINIMKIQIHFIKALIVQQNYNNLIGWPKRNVFQNLQKFLCAEHFCFKACLRELYRLSTPNLVAKAIIHSFGSPNPKKPTIFNETTLYTHNTYYLLYITKLNKEDGLYAY